MTLITEEHFEVSASTVSGNMNQTIMITTTLPVKNNWSYNL